jgi:hypothetical protein
MNEKEKEGLSLEKLNKMILLEQSLKINVLRE